ncbi:hypothetical protein [Rhodopila sp.]|jgi:hypothetical protein|uniref:hypothetical protein n=1 Tax=Rhodopila sp. TaxID=2480087 RepID=UPI002C0007E5|nr:hypothetical protein [Rhodopila sp.]HVZ10326.1 hypothetical protein [Rhodopila sp.]
MRRVLIACAASLLVYAAAFACLLDRPLTLGALRARIDANLAAGAAIDGPKLVILAGSNGPYSHRCAVIGPSVGRPCINAGVAVGVGLDYLFLRWEPLLHPGDMVYLPLEEAQYARGKATAALGPDAAIMLRHDRASLWRMPADRQLAALFSGDLRAAIMSLLETALVATGFQDPRAQALGSTNRWGDHVGHTLLLAAGNRQALAAEQPFHPTAEQIAAGYGTEEVRRFLRWAEAHGVLAIGGLPTGFADSPISEAAIASIRRVYDAEGAPFVMLANRSRYPRSAFFDTPDHLNEPAQIAHSRAIARILRLQVAQAQAARPMAPAVHLATALADPSPPGSR